LQRGDEMDFTFIDITELKKYLIMMIITIIITYSTIYIIKISLTQFFKRTHFVERKKEETAISIISNTANYIAFFVIVIAALKPFVDIQNLLVAGGVLGIVIGFGAQSSIKDVLHGFFFIFEGQFKKGDFVTLNDSLDSGIVEDLGFRALKVRLINGKLLTISNGEILKVVNGNVERRRIFESIVVSFRENPSKVKKMLENICEELNEIHRDFLIIDKETKKPIEPYRVHGLSSLDSNPLGFKFSIVATTYDTTYMEAVQEVKEIIAQRLYDEEIKMPEQNVFYQTRANLK
jgi:moderate conductance mechanosensitive channel